METDQYKTKLIAIKKLIAKNKMDAALEQSKALFHDSPSMMRELETVAAQFHNNEKKYLRNLITYEIYTVQRYKVVQYYLDLFRRQSVDQICSSNLQEEEKEVYKEPLTVEYEEDGMPVSLDDAQAEVSFLLRMMVLDKDYRVVTKKYMKVGQLASTLGIKIFPHLFDQRYIWNLYYLEADREARRGSQVDPYLSIYQNLNSAPTILQLKGEYSYPQSIGFNTRSRDITHGISME